MKLRFFAQAFLLCTSISLQTAHAGNLSSLFSTTSVLYFLIGGYGVEAASSGTQLSIQCGGQECEHPLDLKPQNFEIGIFSFRTTDECLVIATELTVIDHALTYAARSVLGKAYYSEGWELQIPPRVNGVRTVGALYRYLTDELVVPGVSQNAKTTDEARALLLPRLVEVLFLNEEGRELLSEVEHDLMVAAGILSMKEKLQILGEIFNPILHELDSKKMSLARRAIWQNAAGTYRLSDTIGTGLVLTLLGSLGYMGKLAIGEVAGVFGPKSDDEKRWQSEFYDLSGGERKDYDLSGWRFRPGVSADAIAEIASFLMPSEINAISYWSPGLRKAMRVARVKASERILGALHEEISYLPAGFLPNQRAVPAFEATRYPVTRELWDEVMGRAPAAFLSTRAENWYPCPRCPVTYVAYDVSQGIRSEIKEFINRLNEKERSTGCAYRLPSLDQLHYMFRADPTGDDYSAYSFGVREDELDQFYISKANSGGRLQPVGRKRLNAFQIEMGGVSRLSLTPFYAANPSGGLSATGPSWLTGSRDDFRSDKVFRVTPGLRAMDLGFSLVRKCR